MLPAVAVEAVASFRATRSCIQVFHVVNDLRFLWGSFRFNFGSGGIEIVQVGRHQDRVTQDVTMIHVPKVREASIL